MTHHSGNSEVLFDHLIRELVGLSSGVNIYDTLSDSQSLIEILEGVEFPVLLVNNNVELFNTFQGKFVLFNEDSLRFAHKLIGNIEDFSGHGSGEQSHLNITGEQFED